MTPALRDGGRAMMIGLLGADRWYGVRKTVRHILEARRAFADWPWAIGQILTGPVRRDFVAWVREGALLACPNRPAARAPLYNIFAERWYPLAELAGTMPRDCVVFDLGAHVGAFTVAMAAHRPDVRLVSLEAAASSHAYLVRNIERNDLRERVRPLLGAAWGEPGQVEFQDNGSASCINSVVDTYASEFLTGVASAAVPAMTAAELFALAGERAIGMVKVDCEGAEFDFVLRSDPSDWHSVQQVYLEYHPSEQYVVDDLVAWFADAGLRLVKSMPTRFGMGDIWLSRT